MNTEESTTQPIARDASISAAGKLDAYIGKIEVLPPTPSLMFKLLPIFKQTNPDIDEVSKLISHDPAITAEVLKLCNSAEYGGEKTIADMFEAISRLGFYEVYRLVMMISGARTLSVHSVETVLQVEVLCRHSMTTAVIAGVIVKITGESPDGIFIAGLLHDIGKIALASAEGVSYGIVTKKFGTGGDALAKGEKLHFGFDHTEIGSRLLEMWGLPKEIVMAVRHHHDFVNAGEHSELAATIALADILANQPLGRPVNSSANPRLVEALKTLNLNDADVVLIMEQAQVDLKRDEALLSRKSAAPQKTAP